MYWSNPELYSARTVGDIFSATYLHFAYAIVATIGGASNRQKESAKARAATELAVSDRIPLKIRQHATKDNMVMRITFVTVNWLWQIAKSSSIYPGSVRKLLKFSSYSVSVNCSLELGLAKKCKWIFFLFSRAS